MTANQLSNLIHTLGATAEFLGQHADVVDGPDGEQCPNQAMQLLLEIDQALYMANHDLVQICNPECCPPFPKRA